MSSGLVCFERWCLFLAYLYGRPIYFLLNFNIREDSLCDTYSYEKFGHRIESWIFGLYVFHNLCRFRFWFRVCSFVVIITFSWTWKIPEDHSFFELKSRFISITGILLHTSIRAVWRSSIGGSIYIFNFANLILLFI